MKFSPCCFLTSFIAVGLGFLVATVSPSARAASLTWDGGDATFNGSFGGTGTWDLSTPNWSNTAADQIWTDTGGTTDTAIFTGTAGTVTVGTSLGALGMQFLAPSYTITGGTITLGSGGMDGTALSSGTTIINSALVLGAAQAWNVGTGASRIVSGVISGSNNLTVNSTGSGGTLNLGGSNTFTGNLVINSGTLTAGTGITTGTASLPSNLGDLNAALTRSITINNGGTLSLTAGNVLGTGASTNTLGGLTLVINQGGVFQTGLNGSGTGWWNKIGAITLNGGTIHVGSGGNATNFQALALTGNVTVSGTSASTIDTFAASSGTTNGIHLGQNATTGQVITFNVADVTNSSAADLTISANLLNTSSNLVASGLLKTGSGTLRLSGSNSYSGPTTISAGTLVLANQFALQNSVLTPLTGAVVFDSSVSGNAFAIGGLSGTANGNDIVLFNNAGTPAPIALTLGGGGNNASYSAALIGSGVSITKTGAGIQILSGTDSYTGGTIISAGDLQFGKPISMSATGSVSVASGATIGINVGGAGEFTTGTSGAGTIGGLLSGIGGQGTSVTLNSGASIGIDTTNVSGTASYAAPFVTTNNLGLLKTGSGTLSLLVGGTFVGAGAAGFPLEVRQGTLLLAGGTTTITGEAVVGGLYGTANGDPGFNALLQLNSATLNISGFLSVGRGNGIGGISSDMVLNNSTLTAGNYSAGFNGGSTANLPRESLTLNGTSSFTINTNGAFQTAESTGANDTTTLNNTSSITLLGNAVRYIGEGGTSTMTLNGTSIFTNNGTSDLRIGATNGTANGNGNGTLNINNSAFFNNPNGGVVVGYQNGSGTVNMTSGTMTVGSLSIAVSTAATSTDTGVVTVGSGATLNSTGDLTVGLGGTQTGTLNLNGGTVNVGNTLRWLILGRFDTVTSALNINSGALNLNFGTFMRFAPANATTSSTNVVNQNGGTVTFYNDNGVTVGGIGAIDLQAFGGAGLSSTYNLNGGTLTTNKVTSTYTGAAPGGNQSATSTTAPGTRIFNFNGGTLKVASNTYASDFFDLGTGTGIALANVRNGGAIIDTNGVDSAVVTPLQHSNIGGDNAIDGGLIKTGSGALMLSASNTYTGATTISAGTLTTGSTGSINSSSGITVNGSTARLLQTNSTTVITPLVTVTTGTLDGTATVSNVTVGNGTGGVISNGNGTATTLTIGALTFSGAATLNLLTSGSNAAIPALATTTLTTGSNGIVTINANNLDGVWTSGTFDLISYSALAGQGFSAFQKGTILNLTARQAATLTNTGGFIGLVITGVSGFTQWTGALDSRWTIATLANPKNWILQSGSTATDFVTGDAVLFNDSAAGTTTVNISDASVSPTSVTFNNSTLNYTITSSNSFGISGSASVVKNGTGAVTMRTANSYSGGTTLNAGTFNINNASALGTGPLTISGSGVTIDNTSGAAITLSSTNTQNWNSDFAFAGTNALNLGTGAVTSNADRTITVSGSGAFTVGGILSGTTALTKTGTGTLILAGQNTRTGATTVSAGRLTVTGAINAGNTGNVGQITVGNTVGTNAVLNIAGGTVNATNSTNAASLQAGTADGATGVVNLNSGKLVTTNELWLGTAGTAGQAPFGALVINSGTATIGSYLAIGRSTIAGGAARGELVVNGGSLTVNTNQLTIGAFQNTAASTSVATLTGGTTTVGTSTSAGGSVFVGENANAILNVSGSAALNILNNSSTLDIGVVAGVAGIVNLDGGMIIAPRVIQGAGTATFNFNGGTLKASAPSTTFLTGLSNAYVYSGGGGIDNGGNAITIGQSLLSATGGGISASGLIVSGTGFVAAPIVDVTGGDGTGATAVANVDANGNLASITITNPGVGYTIAPTFTLVGGGGVGSVTGTPALVSNTSGGITFSGTGVTTLTGSNTYAGLTTLTGGTLILANGASVNNSSGITANNAALILSNSAAITKAVTLLSSSLNAIGTINSLTVGNGSTVTTGTGGAPTPLTTGSLTFTGTSTLNLTLSGTSPATPGIATTTLSTTGSNTITINATSSNGTWINGQTYDVISYANLVGQGLASFVKGLIPGLTSRQAATLSNPSGMIGLTISGDLPVWTGALDGRWTTATLTSPKNWKLQIGGTPTDFLPSDTVVFDDTATGTPTVNISDASVNPNSTTFNNGAKTYTITSGSGFGIASGFLVKNGTGMVNMTTVNTYSGGTTINAGTFALSGSGTLGASAGAVTVNGGTVDLGSTTQTVGALTISGGTIQSGTLSGSSYLGTNAGTISAVLTGVAPLTKSGNGTLTISGANTYTGLTTVTSGTLQVVPGGIISTTTTVPLIGNISGTNAVLKIAGGTVQANTNGGNAFNTSITAGNVAGAVGSIQLTSGTLAVAQQLTLGGGVGAYGAYTQSGGTATVGGFIAMGLNTDNSVFNQSGGTFTTTGAATVGAGGNASGPLGTGIMTFSGSASYITTGDFGNSGAGIWIGEAGRGELNIMGNATVSTSTNGLIIGKGNGTAQSPTGMVNLLSGTLATARVFKTSTSGISAFSFNGGTLLATGSSATFMTGLSNAYVYSGGGTINNGGKAITIAQPLVAPSGSGVTSITLSSTGTGYIDTPVVTISGGTLNFDGVAATAVANMDYATGRITGITITNPGGYADTTGLTVTFNGGGGTAPTINTINTAANVSGGMTFSGTGSTTLDGANTYSGVTNVTSGRLIVEGSITGSRVNVAAGAVLASGAPFTVSQIAPTDTTSNAVVISGMLSPGTVGTIAPINFSLQTGAKLNFQTGSTLLYDVGASNTADVVLFGSAGDWLTGSGKATLALNGTVDYTSTYTVFSNVTTTGFSFASITGYDTAHFSAKFAQVGTDYQLTFAAVPEPGTWTLLLLGGVGILFQAQRARRRSRKA